MWRIWPVLLGILLTLPMHGQVTITGRVVDAVTNEPLAFVHVVAEGLREGRTSDIDGRFAMPVPELPVGLRFSYVGYAPLLITATEAGPLHVAMQRTAVDLAMVVVLPGENPAHRIIDRVRANRRENDALRHRPHQYTSYSKTVFTAAVDSAALTDSARYAALSDGTKKSMAWLDEQHLLLIESATRRSFIPPAAEKEEVLAMRVSGLKDPSLLALAASTKTFSMYAPQIELGERTYLSPLGPNGTDRYLFLLEDTLYQGPDTIFIISYRPRTGRKFDGLKGQLHVHTDGYALQHVIAEPAEEKPDGMGIKLQQRFTRVPTGADRSGPRAWFPDQLNTFLYFPFMQVNDLHVIGVGRTYLQDISVDLDLERRMVRGPEFEMSSMAVRRNDAFWDSLRVAPLDARDLRTYHVIDSVSQAEGLETKLKWATRLMTGRIPMGVVDLQLDRLMAFNGYEGWRLGAGFATNDRLTRHASLGAYGAYGFRDKAWKYGGEIIVKPWPGHGPQLRLHHAHDVLESAGVSFQGMSRAITGEPLRMIYVDRMDRVDRTGAELMFRVGGPLRVWLGTSRTDRWAPADYHHATPMGEQVTLLSDNFLTGEVSIGIRYAFREPLARLPEQDVPLGTRWPVLYLNATRAVHGLWGGEMDLWRVNAMVEKTFRLRMLGEMSMRLLGGMAQTDAPYSFLYHMRGVAGPGLLVAVRHTFETMRPNEFLADRYVSVHLRHSFGHLLMKPRGRFAPVPSVVVSAGIGELAHPERHRGFDVKAPDRGFAEAGLQVDRLLRVGLCRLGVGAFHRLGPYMHGELSDDLAVKLTLDVGF